MDYRSTPLYCPCSLMTLTIIAFHVLQSLLKWGPANVDEKHNAAEHGTRVYSDISALKSDDMNPF